MGYNYPGHSSKASTGQHLSGNEGMVQTQGRLQGSINSFGSREEIERLLQNFKCIFLMLYDENERSFPSLPRIVTLGMASL